ncbi:MAG: hypothetical protein R3C11_01060 [Planctomycetaceae bacterium]
MKLASHTILSLILACGLSTSVTYGDDEPTAPPASGIKIVPKATATPEDPANDPTIELQQALEGYVAAFNERCNWFAQLLSPEGIYVTPAGDELKGQAELKDAFEAYFKDLDPAVRLEIPVYEHEIISLDSPGSQARRSFTGRKRTTAF